MSTKRTLVVDYEADRELVLSGTKAVKRHFLESELKTADDLIHEYAEYAGDVQATYDSDPATRHKLIWLLERLQEEVL